MMVTTTLYKYVQSELIKMGKSEIVEQDNDKFFDPPLNFIWFDDDLQFTTKIIKYDDDVSQIVNNLFGGLTLKDKEHDTHFKKGFINRFIDRQINRQTIESFQSQLVATFLEHEDYLNNLYENMDKFITQEKTSIQDNEQENKQQTDGETVSNNRSAFADLPQSSVNLDVDNTNMSHASDNTIAKNKQKNEQQVSSESKGKTENVSNDYNFDELMKSSNVITHIYNEFDKKCFLQIW